MGSDGDANRGADEFWIPHWSYLETYDEYFEHPAQIRTPGGSPGHGRWNISGIGLPGRGAAQGVLRERAAVTCRRCAVPLPGRSRRGAEKTEKGTVTFSERKVTVPFFRRYSDFRYSTRSRFSRSRQRRAEKARRSDRRRRAAWRSGRRDRSRPSCGSTVLQRRGPVAAIGRAIRLEVVDADLRGRVHVPARLREERRDVAASRTAPCP